MMQRTLTGDLISLQTVEEIRYTPSAPVHDYLVEFYTEDGNETWERVKIEDREIEDRSASERATLAAQHQSPYDNLETFKITQVDEADDSYTDEWRIEEI